jgi:hypothetical protein
MIILIMMINETELPSHDLFYSKMKNKNVSDEEYNICINAWKDNNMKTFKDLTCQRNTFLTLSPSVPTVSRKAPDQLQCSALQCFSCTWGVGVGSGEAGCADGGGDDACSGVGEQGD